MAINTSYNNLLRYVHFKPALLSEDEVDIVRVNAWKRENRGKRDKYSPSKEKNEFLKSRGFERKNNNGVLVGFLIGIIIGNLEVLLLEVTETIVNILVEKKSIIIKKIGDFLF